MDIKLESIGQTLVVKLAGEIDHHTSGEIKEILDREISSGNIVNLVFDFDKVTFMDSSGIGMMVGRYKQISALGGKVMVIRVSHRLDKIFEISGLKKILDFGKEQKQWT
ncbi:MAG: anti-sigma F factor antagonist [Clostridia bacterium]|nr:anti-sigma F factor antagonist [Clostridia bacterium]